MEKKQILIDAGFGRCIKDDMFEWRITKDHADIISIDEAYYRISKNVRESALEVCKKTRK